MNAPVHVDEMHRHAYIALKLVLQIVVLFCAIEHIHYPIYSETNMSQTDLPVLYVTHGA